MISPPSCPCPTCVWPLTPGHDCGGIFSACPAADADAIGQPAPISDEQIREWLDARLDRGAA